MVADCYIYLRIFNLKVICYIQYIWRDIYVENISIYRSIGKTPNVPSVDTQELIFIPVYTFAVNDKGVYFWCLFFFVDSANSTLST